VHARRRNHGRAPDASHAITIATEGHTTAAWTARNGARTPTGVSAAGLVEGLAAGDAKIQVKGVEPSCRCRRRNV